MSVVNKMPAQIVEDTEAIKDNTPDAWAAEAVNYAVKNGILYGDENGNYKLHNDCTRQEMLVFFVPCVQSNKEIRMEEFIWNGLTMRFLSYPD